MTISSGDRSNQETEASSPLGDTASLPSSRRRRRESVVGAAMQFIAIAGVATAIAGLLIGWRFVERIDGVVEETTAISTDALTALDDTIVLADQLLSTVQIVLRDTEGSLRAVAASFDSAETVINDVSDVLSQVAPAVAGVADTTRNLASVGSAIDDVLGQLNQIPLGPRYDENNGLGSQFENLADDLDPLAEGLSDTDKSLDGFLTDTAEIETQLQALVDATADLNEGVAEADVLLADYAEASALAQSVARDTTLAVGEDLVWYRLLLIMATATFAALQIIPWWLGSTLRSGGPLSATV